MSEPTATPAVTIVICTRNRAPRLHLVLDALSRIQSQYDWDVLMVDNASTDNTAEVIKTYDKLGSKLVYAYCERIGLGAARDFAWRLAKSDILAFTDDDCYPEPDFIDAIVDVFGRNPKAGLIGGRILLFDPTDVEMTLDTRTVAKDKPPFSHLWAGAYQGANMAVRKTALAKAGGFDPELGAGTPFPCEDIDVAAAISWAGYVTRFDPAAVVYHHHGRKEADVEKLWKSYDAGRGAYYAKYLLRKDTRRTYLIGWCKRMVLQLYNNKTEPHAAQFIRELRAARDYALSKNAKTFVAISTPIAYVALALVAGASALLSVRLLFGTPPAPGSG